MSEIITNKLTGKTAAGNVTITDGGGNQTYTLQEGIIHSYVKMSQTAATTGESHNVSSITDNSAGSFNANYTNAFESADIPVTMANSGYHENYAISTTVITHDSQNDSHAATDAGRICSMAAGDLA